MEMHNGDTAATDKYLREYWGDDFDEMYKEYLVTDVYAGRYHGTGEDMTKEISAYLSKMAASPTERAGCVQVDARLAEILQQLMDKYTFKNVDHSWTKLCYYYRYVGPAS